MANKKNIPEIRFKGFDDDWEERKIKDICLISTGKSNTQDRIENGLYPFYVRSATIERSNRYLYDEEAVLTVGDGVGTGKVYHYVKGKFDLHQRVYRMFDFNNGVSGKYFYYYFSNNFYKRVMSMTAKTSVDSVRLDMIADMLINYPILTEQEKISCYLDNLDKLITLHQNKYNKVVTLKKAMLEKMFPKNGEAVPEIRFKGFEGEWEKDELGELTDVYDGTHQTPVYTDSGVMFLSVENIKTLKSKKFISKKAFEEEFKIFPKKGDVLMTRIGDIGTANVVESDEPKAYYVSLALLKQKDLDPYFLKESIFSETVKKDLWHRTLHIAFPKKINKNEIAKVSIPYPKSNEEQIQIGKYFNNLDKLISLHQKELDKLKLMKKACLEKMFV
ncbi:restriction endonuclease subunit S [Labilibaculum sp. A4]|uniref:restriction endonuclease subunit S n=1 Tax=Labilibaculum euxinus TaxID=2686357 RepID=UPI000F62108B|nr:restriction endonuclease subunit S [Labilibaculum euxinus]MDQ1770499.1 restriction endonuclease subunit S [Labilibaculum euxinus]MWN75282.1 restriction endonuclease subunit S [Labilibaculum euxinus]